MTITAREILSRVHERPWRGSTPAIIVDYAANDLSTPARLEPKWTRLLNQLGPLLQLDLFRRPYEDIVEVPARGTEDRNFAGWRAAAAHRDRLALAAAMDRQAGLCLSRLQQ